MRGDQRQREREKGREREKEREREREKKKIERDTIPRTTQKTDTLLHSHRTEARSGRPQNLTDTLLHSHRTKCLTPLGKWDSKEMQEFGEIVQMKLMKLSISIPTRNASAENSNVPVTHIPL